MIRDVVNSRMVDINKILIAILCVIRMRIQLIINVINIDACQIKKNKEMKSYMAEPFYRCKISVLIYANYYTLIGF